MYIYTRQQKKQKIATPKNFVMRSFSGAVSAESTMGNSGRVLVISGREAMAFGKGGVTRRYSPLLTVTSWVREQADENLPGGGGWHDKFGKLRHPGPRVLAEK